MVSLILFMIITRDIIHSFSFALHVWLLFSLISAMAFEEWVTETHTTPTIERLLQRITTFWQKVIPSVYIAFRVFCHLMRHSSIICAIKIATKFALRLISDTENHSWLKRKNGWRNVRSANTYE